ncbi:MAG TPA: energy transducer TonB [Opitutaceae bacterium]
MRRTLLFPSAVALGLHALLLFGFKSPRAGITPPPRPGPVDPIVVQPTVLPPPDERLIDVEDSTVRPPRSAQSVPTQPEILGPRRPGDITMPMPPTPPPRVPGRPVDRIPPVWSASDGDDLKPSGRPLIAADFLDSPPRTRYQVAPQYPYSARQNGLNGEVVVTFDVDERGVVYNARVVRSTDREFEEPTLRAVEKWRFQPGKKDGRPVRFRMAVPVVFNVDA